MNNDNVFLKMLAFAAIRIFLAAWLVDIAYDLFAPENWTHFTYWQAIGLVVLFNITVGSLRKMEDENE